jgi:hypothetical protein
MCKYTTPSCMRSWNYQFLKMAAFLYSCTKQEMWSVIQISRRCHTNRNLYKNVGQIQCMVYEWNTSLQAVPEIQEPDTNCWRFSWPGKAHCVITTEMTVSVDDILWENHCITISEIAMEMNISVGCADTIHPEKLHCRRSCVWWILRRLTPEI